MIDEDELLEQSATHIDELLSIPRQVWLLGAGVSKEAGVPLMYTLTSRVKALLDGQDACFPGQALQRSAEIFQLITDSLPETSHVEHVLSHLGDLIALADRQSVQKVTFGGESLCIDELDRTHRHIQYAIRHIVEHGYTEAREGQPERIGAPGKPIIDRSHHSFFVDSLFSARRAGLEQNPPVRFVTTNYDTLLEDALAHAHVACVDGFAGGATGFWDPRNSQSRLEQAAKNSRHISTICKLHGSVDWIADKEDVVMRVRASEIELNGSSQQLLIYPQATKYQVTQRDPFATLFADFRALLLTPAPTVLIICGYSFGDDHINEEIERALRTGPSSLTVLALVWQAKNSDGTLPTNDGLPPVLVNWLSNAKYGNRIVVAGRHGYYRKSLENRISSDREYDWWTFQGITAMLSNGIEAVL